MGLGRKVGRHKERPGSCISDGSTLGGSSLHFHIYYHAFNSLSGGLLPKMKDHLPGTVAPLVSFVILTEFDANDLHKWK